MRKVANIDFKKLREDINSQLSDIEVELRDYRDVLNFMKNGKSSSARGIVWAKSEGMTIEGVEEILEILERFRDSLTLLSTEVSKCEKIDKVTKGTKNIIDVLDLSTNYAKTQQKIAESYLSFSTYFEESKELFDELKSKIRKE